MGSKGDLLEEGIVIEARGMQDKAIQVLLAAAVEADGWAGKYVYADRVMEHANISGAITSDEQDFGALEVYLDGKGYITEGGDDCGMFAVTPEGMGEATRRPRY